MNAKTTSTAVPCPQCSTPTRCHRTWTTAGRTTTYRRRRCPKCGHRCTTAERVVGTTAEPDTRNVSIAAAIKELADSLHVAPQLASFYVKLNEAPKGDTADVCKPQS